MAEEKKSEGKRFQPDEVIAKQRNRQLAVVTIVIVLLSMHTCNQSMLRKPSTGSFRLDYWQNRSSKHIGSACK